MSDTITALVNGALVPAGLMLIMFSTGLTLSLRDFALVLKSSKLVAGGFLGHMVMLPLLGLAVGALFGLRPELALGLFIISICPAGTTSNALTFVGGGNVALAVVLTALSSVVTVFTIPLLLSWALPYFLGAAGIDVPELSVPDTILQLVRITVLPVIAGMTVRRISLRAARDMARWLRPTSLIVLIGVIAFSVVVSLDMVLANLLAAGPAIWTLNVAAMAGALLIARFVRANRRDSMTIAIEIGVQNVTLAIFLTLSVLGSLPLAVTQNIYGVVMIVNVLILLRWRFRDLAPREGASNDDRL